MSDKPAMQNAPDNTIIKDNAENFNCNAEEYKKDSKKSASVGYAKRNLKETETDTISINDNVENFNCNTEEYKNGKSSSEYSANTRGLELSQEDTTSINDNSKDFNIKLLHNLSQ